MDSKKTNAASDLDTVRKMIQTCIQCGTCSASCPNSFAMDITPRKLWRLVLMDRPDAVFNSKTFMLCSSCYYCTLRCPRGLPLTDAMARLKQIAGKKTPKRYKESTFFYREFLESVRRYGRVREMEFMALYFWRMKNPLLPLRFASLGLKLALNGKISLALPSPNATKLDALFEHTANMEKRS